LSRLSKDLVEHRLPLKEGFKLYKQLAQGFNPEVLQMVKKKVECLLSSEFIRRTEYADWLSNIVPLIKKKNKVCVCANFRNLNLVIPKDE